MRYWRVTIPAHTVALELLGRHRATYSVPAGEYEVGERHRGAARALGASYAHTDADVPPYRSLRRQTALAASAVELDPHPWREAAIRDAQRTVTDVDRLILDALLEALERDPAAPYLLVKDVVKRVRALAPAGVRLTGHAAGGRLRRLRALKLVESYEGDGPLAWVLTTAAATSRPWQAA